MKIMQIGAGRWGANHLRVWSSLGVELFVAEVSASQRTELIVQGMPEDHITDDYRVFKDIVSAVDVVSPAPTHFFLCTEFIEDGKDIFVEKPISETVSEAEELAAQADRTNVVLQVGHIFRYDPATGFIKAFLDSGQLGAIHSLSGAFSGFKRPRSDGGVLISDAIHFIDFFNYLIGGLPKKVFCRSDDFLKRGIDDMAWIMMDYEGIPAIVEANYFAPDKKRLVTIIGEEATLVCDFTSSQDKVVIYQNRHILDNNTWKAVSEETIRKEIPPSEPLLVELKDFLHCVETRSQPRADARSGVDSMKVVEAAILSNKEERVIMLR